MYIFEKRPILVAIIFVIVSSNGLSSKTENANAQSMWANRSQSQIASYRDTRARRVGDLITVAINETTDVQNQDSRALSKSTNADGSLDTGYGGSGTSGNITADYQTSSQRNFDGSTSFNSARNFSDRFTVAVLDVQPNGNMLIGGLRSVEVGQDQRTLVLSGMIRAVDIRADNSVNSQLVANLELKYAGKGVETEYTRQGWLMRKITKIWPF